MKCGSFLVTLTVLAVSSTAPAGNSDEVNAGVDVTLTAGAVVANVSTGAALWYNPAGLARYDKASFELSGITFKVSAVKAPGLLTLETGERSSDRRVDISMIPEAITFTSARGSRTRLTNESRKPSSAAPLTSSSPPRGSIG